MATKFFYVCAGIFLLALSYHFGAGTATAQAPSNPVVGVFDRGAVITANGDIYANYGGASMHPWGYVTNIFNGTTTSRTSTFGQVKVGAR